MSNIDIKRKIESDYSSHENFKRIKVGRGFSDISQNSKNNFWTGRYIRYIFIPIIVSMITIIFVINKQ